VASETGILVFSKESSFCFAGKGKAGCVASEIGSWISLASKTDSRFVEGSQSVVSSHSLLFTSVSFAILKTFATCVAPS